MHRENNSIVVLRTTDVEKGEKYLLHSLYFFFEGIHWKKYGMEKNKIHRKYIYSTNL